eukprot:TRINITY_DN3527_c0_g1_i1.p1 TRINITY_DN3527_c0_g1~~TRINITY_DN3527_c0_g1_i1.p1  ORF type:complete len:999 (-),score=182.44 TRINITY_DN3527_c0_g1_i1:222-3218(-)
MAFCSEILKPTVCCRVEEKKEQKQTVHHHRAAQQDEPKPAFVKYPPKEEKLEDLRSTAVGHDHGHSHPQTSSAHDEPTVPQGVTKEVEFPREVADSDAKKEQRVSPGYLEALRNPPPTDVMEGGWSQNDVVLQESQEPAEEPPGMLNEEDQLDFPRQEEFAEEEEINYDAKKERCKMIFFSGGVLVSLFAYAAYMVNGASTFSSDTTCDPAKKYKTCEPCGSGTLFLPIGGEMEKAMSQALRAPFYFIGLVWCFLGVAIVCDSFMEAIEEITSAERVLWVDMHNGSMHKFHVRVWNSTVANLTLMALGSSAPEILLSCIELVGNDFFAGELGPSTIVGSAAFNLLVITAVCVKALPNGEIRKVEMTTVFAVTATCSVWAYLWLLVILVVWTPNKVDVEEGVITFVMFPVLVVVAYCADKGWLDKLVNCRRQQVSECAVTQAQASLSKQYSKSISFDTAKVFLELAEASKKKPGTRTRKSEFRQEAIASWFGGKGSKEIQFGFKNSLYAVLECCGSASVTVTANRPPGCVVRMRFMTRDGGAKAGSKYAYTDGLITFDCAEVEKTISIPILDDNQGGALQQDFTVELSDLSVVTGQKAMPDPTNRLHFSRSSTRVVIIDDDDAGVFAFSTDEVMCSGAADEISVMVTRSGGTCGVVTMDYETQDLSAVRGVDFTYASGKLVFEPGENRKSLHIPVRSMKREEEKLFRVCLRNATGGGRFDAESEGGIKEAFCEVILPGSSNVQKKLTCGCKPGVFSDWGHQFTAALYVGGGPGEQSKAGLMEFVFHGLAVTWKVIFAFVPPAGLCGGWVCFFVALCMIGSVTAVIADLASLLGCTIGLTDDITAITLVALGTSLPDTFASRSAAQHDDCADNSVGNVTGSNSVNVFLGLGLPWTIAAVYWQKAGATTVWLDREYKGSTYRELYAGDYPGGGFLVPAGSLGFSVTVFVIVASSGLILLIMRRRLYGGELGGPAFAAQRDAAILTLLWFVYVIASIVQSTM